MATAVKVSPTREQLQTVGYAINLWKDPGETLVAKLEPDGRVLLGVCAAGTWDFTHIARDGQPDHPWF